MNGRVAQVEEIKRMQYTRKFKEATELVTKAELEDYPGYQESWQQ